MNFRDQRKRSRDPRSGLRACLRRILFPFHLCEKILHSQIPFETVPRDPHVSGDLSSLLIYYTLSVCLDYSLQTRV
ncbi:uncharacterized protein DS421_11g347140 [Arachis hypogaea]|nr:uncharacterized protein DS421_11g347140 [Arachis hypogaea]